MSVPPGAAVIDPNMSDRTVVGLLRVTVVIGGALAVIGSAVVIAIGHAGSWWSEFFAFLTLFSVFFAVFVWLVIPQQPRNAVLWTMAASAFFGGLAVAGVAGAALLVDAPNLVFGGSVVPADLPGSAAWILAFTNWAWVWTFIPLLTFGLLLFPDGTLPSPRWRWVGVFAGVAILVTTVADAWIYRPGSTVPIEVAEDEGLLLFAGIVAFMFAILLSLAALVGRFRRSSGATREQFKWVVWGASSFVPALLVSIIFGGTRYEGLGRALLMAATAVFLASYGIAVGKYRLYGIDVVINKTLAAGAVALALGATYVSVVAGAGWLLRSGGQTELGPQVAATALVAIAFQPVRRRAQQWANRAVYGRRATPYEVLSRFSHRAAEASDDELLARIPRLIVDGTGAVEATIWVRSDEGFRAAATWPESIERTEIPATDSFEDPDADYSLTVFHDGELLGGLSLVKTRGEALPPAEEQLVANLASGMGLALRNVGLTSQLREQVAELEASRERILAAADEARRALEHDLDSGSQQQLVALKVMVGPTRKLAEQAGATRTADVLARLEADAGEAIRAVRDFSGGVYPPLLEAEGLATAITHQTQKTALPVDVRADGLDRYSREVEAAVYFTILEALQNIAKYAGASSVSVVLRQADGRLSFEVTDDGSGFDTSMVVAGSGLANMADRLDAVGATLSLESVPGSGTTVQSTVPIGDRVTSY